MDILKRLKYLDREFFRFVLVGIVNTLFGTTLMFVLYNIFHLDYWWSSSMNYFFGSILSFFLNKYFTFTIKYWNIYMVFIFFINIIICYLIAYTLAKPLVHHLLRNNSITVRDNFAMLLGICIFTALNYFGQKFIVFRKK